MKPVLFQFQVSAAERARLKRLLSELDRSSTWVCRHALQRGERLKARDVSTLQFQRTILEPGPFEGSNVKLVCTAEEKARWEGHAKRLGLSAGEFARLALFTTEAK